MYENIKKECDWYPYIEEFLNRRGITLLINEVRFQTQLKSIDLLGSDNRNYYLIEVKKDSIKEDDYYNLKYIIENNKLDKPLRGLLFERKKSKNINLYKEINQNLNIKLISFEEYEEIILRPNAKKISNSKCFWNEDNRELRRIFMYICDESIKEIIFSDGITFNSKFREIVYEIGEIKARFIPIRDRCRRYKDTRYEDNGILDGKLYIEEYDDLINDYNRRPIEICTLNLKRELTKIKIQNIVNTKKIENELIEDVLNYTYIIFKDFERYLFEKAIRRSGIMINGRNEILFIDINKKNHLKIWVNFKWEYLYHENDININVKNVKVYNIINYIEFTNIIIGARIFEPIKYIRIENGDVIITLKMFFYENKEKIEFKKEYKMRKYLKNDKIDFCLICNTSIILDFEKIILDNIKNKGWKPIKNYANDYLNNCLRDGYLRKLDGVKTTREYIKELEKKHNPKWWEKYINTLY